MLRTTSDPCRPAEVRSGAPPRIILVDGVAGSGKSTTAQWITLASPPGQRASWYHENDERLGPALFFEGRRSCRDYRESVRERWEELVERVGGGEAHTAVVEGALLQTPIVGLLLADFEAERILELIDEIAALVRTVPACLVYLTTTSVESTLRRATSSRYEGLLAEYIARNDASAYARARDVRGLTGLVRFWEELREIATRARSRLEMPTVLVDTAAGDWENQRESIASFLAMQGHVLGDVGEWKPTDRELSPYTGRYGNGAAGGPLCEVRIQAGALVVVGLAPYLWAAGNRLIPQRPGVFAAASWPAEVVFEENDGYVTALRLSTTSGRAMSEMLVKVHDR